MLCISGFIDDVIFARKPRLLDVTPEHSACAALGMAINGTQQYQLQANGRTGLLIGRLNCKVVRANRKVTKSIWLNW